MRHTASWRGPSPLWMSVESGAPHRALYPREHSQYRVLFRVLFHSHRCTVASCVSCVLWQVLCLLLNSRCQVGLELQPFGRQRHSRALQGACARRSMTQHGAAWRSMSQHDAAWRSGAANVRKSCHVVARPIFSTLVHVGPHGTIYVVDVIWWTSSHALFYLNALHVHMPYASPCSTLLDIAPCVTVGDMLRHDNNISRYWIILGFSDMSTVVYCCGDFLDKWRQMQQFISILYVCMEPFDTGYSFSCFLKLL